MGRFELVLEVFSRGCCRVREGVAGGGGCGGSTVLLPSSDHPPYIPSYRAGPFIRNSRPRAPLSKPSHRILTSNSDVLLASGYVMGRV